MQYDIDELANTIKYAKAELNELEQSGKAFTFGANTEAAQKQIDELSKEEAKLADMNNRLRTSYQSLEERVNSYKDELSKANNEQKKATKSTKNMDKATKSSGISMARMLGTSILFSTVFQAISAVMNGVTEGMNNLAQYSDETNATLSMLMSSLTQLKNAFATAFAPILTAIAPALNYLINLLTAAATAVAQLIAVLTGKDTFVKATKVQQNYAESLENTAGAADEAEGSLASFDKLNVMQEQNGGGSGGGGNALSPDEMFETVPVDNSLTKAIDAVKEKWLELSNLFKKGFTVGIGDLSVLDSIRTSLSDIQSDVKDIFSDSGVQSAFTNWLNTMVYNYGRMAGAFTSVGLTIADNILGGFSKYLSQNKERIKQYLISMFDISSSISTISANFAVAVADIFSVFRSDTAKQITADIISIFTNAFMGITELVGKLFRDVLNLMLTPFTENADAIKEALQNTLGPIQEVLGTIANTVSDVFSEFNTMYDEHLAPLFESFTQGWSEILESLLDGYNTYFAPVLDNLASKFSDVWQGTIQPLLSNVIGLIGDVADLVKAFWENVLQPFINWIAQNILPVISPVIEGIGTLFLNVFDGIGTVINTFLELLRSVIQFITGVFAGDWKNAWEGLKTDFSTIFNKIPDIVKGVINKVLDGVQAMINGAIKGLNALIDGANGLVGNIPGVSDSLIPSIPEINLPRLASGTVIPPRAGEFAAILGDNKRETEVVSPLSTMKQAFKEALREYGGLGTGGDITGYIYLDGTVLGRSTVKFVRQEKKRTGRNPVLV